MHRRQLASCQSRSFSQPAAAKLDTVFLTRHIYVAFWLALVIWLFSGAMTFAQETANETADAAEATDSEKEATEDVTVEIDLFDGSVPTSVEQLQKMQAHFAELAEKVKPATVNIQVGMAQGSGVIVTREGYVLTAAHVIGGPNKDAVVQLPDGTELKAKTLGLNRTIDSGLVKITEKGKFPYLDMGESEPLQLGQWVMAIGHPGGWDEDRGLVVRIGRIVSKVDRALGTDCTLVGGDSGGPLVDMDGNVIGIHSRIGSSLSQNWHVPIDTYHMTWDKLTDGDDWGSGIGGTNGPWLGFSLEDNSMSIDRVVPGGPAARVGLKRGDVILELHGSEVDSHGKLLLTLRDLKPKQKVKIKYKRGDETIEVEMEVGSTNDRP